MLKDFLNVSKISLRTKMYYLAILLIVVVVIIFALFLITTDGDGTTNTLTMIGTPANIRAKVDGRNLHLAWSKVPGAKFYLVTFSDRKINKVGQEGESIKIYNQNSADFELAKGTWYVQVAAGYNADIFGKPSDVIIIPIN